MAAFLVYNQVGNWRTTEIQFQDEDGVPIDLTGATGNLISTAPDAEIGTLTPITLGKEINVSPDTQASNAEDGWCYATFTGINVAGAWNEQMKLMLAGNTEPLNGAVVQYTVSGNLMP